MWRDVSKTSFRAAVVVRFADCGIVILNFGR